MTDGLPKPTIAVSTDPVVMIGTGTASYVVPPTPDDLARLTLAADRIRRLAHVANQGGAHDLAQPLLVAEGIMRQHARDVGPLAGIRMSHQMADAILGEDDGRPLP